MPISRRKFIKNSAAAASALALWPGAGSEGEAAGKPALTFDRDIPQFAFVAAELRLAAARSGAAPDVEMKIDPALGAQSYRIERTHTGGLTVTGGDANGAMYGGLDVAEAVRLGTLDGLKGGLRSPYIAQRGIKFNIPLDARTPSYSDAGDAAQQNIPEMWSQDFWHEFLDEMAHHRYNVLTLWNLHPFPSLVRVPEYPEVALDDVMRTTVKPDTSMIGGTASDMVSPRILANLETVKTLPMDAKITFWREVMQYAHDRGIGVYLFTWNIFVWGAEGKYGITDAQDNPATIDYTRRSVREALLTYPLLQGIGITSGEHMQGLKGEFTNEKWLWKTYGEGITDVKKLHPDRRIRLIHRFHQTSIGDISDEWKDYTDAFDFSYKYSVAHMYSSPTPHFAQATLDALPPGRRTWLTVRNDDIYSFRWGDPEYARAYVRGMQGPDKLAGFYMGPDGYIWGREFISTEPDAPRQLVIQKQKYSFMLWGRLSYDPSLPNTLFERTLSVRFPEVDGAKLFAASRAASQIIPQVTRFFWGGAGNDFEWFPEACTRRPGGHAGFYTVTQFMTGHAMPGAGVLDIPAYVAQFAESERETGMTPPQVAEALKVSAATTLQLLAEMPSVKDKELRLTLGDLAAMAHLGNYYAEKILGATELALFKKTKRPEHQVSAIRHLEAALGHWIEYGTVYTRQYLPQVLTRIGYVNIVELADSARQDVLIARDAHD